MKSGWRVRARRSREHTLGGLERDRPWIWPPDRMLGPHETRFRTACRPAENPANPRVGPLSPQRPDGKSLHDLRWLPTRNALFGASPSLTREENHAVQADLAGQSSKSKGFLALPCHVRGFPGQEQQLRQRQSVPLTLWKGLKLARTWRSSARTAWRSSKRT
jgi:hypothetical protein